MSKGSRILDSELQWYWCERDGDLGRRGVSLEPQIRGDREPGPSASQLAASAQARRIEAALFALSLRDQHILHVAHTPLLPALRASLADLGELAGVVVDTVPAATLASALQDARRRARVDAPARDAPARDAARGLLARWRAAAGALVATAVDAYRAERRGLVLAERQAVAQRQAVRTRERGVRLLGRVA